MRFGLIVLVMLIAGIPATTRAGDRTHYSVLILEERTWNSPKSIKAIPSFIATLNEESRGSVYAHVEDLGLPIFDVPGYYDILRNFLREKYRNTKLSVIVCNGALSLPYAIRLRDEVWPEATLVFAGILDGSSNLLARPDNFIGVTVQHRLQDTVDLARAIVPNLQNIVLVGDQSSSASLGGGPMLNRRYAEASIQITDLAGHDIGEVERHISTLPREAVVVYSGLTRGQGDARYDPQDILQSLAAKSSRPIIVDDEALLGYGALGGLVVDHAALGRQAARRTWAIISGAQKPTMQMETVGASMPIFDWRQLQKWGVQEEALPQGSKIRFRPPTAWERYRVQIVLVVAALLFQLWLIVWLVQERRARRHAELETRHRLGEIARLNRLATASTLAASVAHELNQPLGAIVSSGGAALRWLNRAAPDIGEALAALKHIVNEGHRASKIIAATRSMVRMETGERSLLDVNDLVRDVCTLARHHFTRNHIATEIVSRAGLPPVFGNRVQLQQTIMNLVINAVDAMRAVSRRSRSLNISTETDSSGKVLIMVADTGVGFDPTHDRMIFDAFYTTKPTGMGLGLSICQTIIKAHNGELRATPREPHGSTFTIVLPAYLTTP